MNHNHVRANEICTNKGADTAVCLIMNAMTRQEYCDTANNDIDRKFKEE